MAGGLGTQQILATWHSALAESVRRAGPDLSARQMAILLTIYLDPPPHTVRGLATALKLPKPAVTRALDRLGELDFARRRRDPDDRRSVVVQRTVKGSVHLSEFADLVRAATAAAAPDSPA